MCLDVCLLLFPGGQDCKDTHGNWKLPAVIEQLKAEAQEANLWNLFLPSDFIYQGANGFTHEEYAIMAEVIGRYCSVLLNFFGR